MRDIITLHIGQAGVQIGNAIWELFCLEHGISEDGSLMEAAINERENKGAFFLQTATEKFVPKCLFVDLEPSVIDEVRIGGYKHLYNPDKLISGPEDAASNFARGFFTVGKLLLEKVGKELRKLFEASDNLQAFMLFRSLGGGTGSGLTSALFDRLSEYPKTSKVEFPIFPSPALSMSTVEPYNSILAEHFCIEDIDVGLSFDNEALYDISKNFLNINCPTFTNINRLLAPLTSSITASLRFDNILNCDLTLLATNLVPYPRIHFPLCNFAPIIAAEKANSERLSIHELTRNVFERDNQMMKIDMSYGRYMSCVLFYRGAISPKEVYGALMEIKNTKTIQFVNWCPTGFKVGINNSIPKSVPSSKIAQTNQNIAMLTNSSAIGQAWQRLCHKFYLLYSKRSFLHWFVGEGMDECEFTEALFNISTLVKDYEEVSVDLGGADGADALMAARLEERQGLSKKDSREPSRKGSQEIIKSESHEMSKKESREPSRKESREPSKKESHEPSRKESTEPIKKESAEALHKEPSKKESHEPSRTEEINQVDDRVTSKVESQVEYQNDAQVEAQLEAKLQNLSENLVKSKISSQEEMKEEHVDGLDDDQIQDQNNQNYMNSNDSFNRVKSIFAYRIGQNMRCLSANSH